MAMPAEDAKRLRHLEALCRRQQATIGALESELRRLNNELTIERAETQRLRGDLIQEREAHRLARKNLADLLHSVENLDERIKAWARRQYVASSERAITDAGQLFITEVLEQVRDEHGEPIAALIAEGDKDEDVVGSEGPAAADASSTPAETESTAAQSVPDRSKRKRPANAGGRHRLPADLPREEIVYQPPADHPMLANVLRSEQIGTTQIERLDISPVRVVVQVLTCPVYSLHLRGGIKTQQTMTPPGVIERGQVSDRFLVTSAVDKVQDHLPAYRQEKRFARTGAEIRRSKLCRWHMRLAAFLEPVAEAIFDEILQSPVLGIDDSVHRLLVPDRHVCKQGRVIAVSAPAGIFYQFQETRQAQWFTQLLATYTGSVMGDAYSGHNRLLARDDILALFCWAHARRKFFHSADKRRKAVILDLIRRLYAIEDDIAGQPPDKRVGQRRQRAGPILAQIYDLLTSWQADPAVLPKSGIGKATAYVLNRWDGFTAYLDQGLAPIDNNHVEQGMRANAMYRKNSLFSASRRGAESYATLLTVTQSAWLHSLDPHSYLLDVIDSIHHRRRPLHQLTPAVYASRGMCVVGKPS